MSSSKIDDLISTLESASKTNDVKLEIQKAQLDFWSKFVSATLSIVAITVAIFAALDLKSISDPDKRVALYLIIFASSVFVLYFMFHWIFMKKIMRHLVGNYSHTKTVLEVFKVIEGNLNEKMAELDTQTSITKIASENLANSPLSNLISWHHSAELEIQATRVYAISIDLSWVNNDEQLNKIIEDLKKNLTDRYYYIVASSSNDVDRNILEITNRINREETSAPNLNIKSRFQIKRLCDLKIDGIQVFKDRSFLLPIPSDIVVYKCDTKSTVVISTDKIKTERKTEDYIKNYDVKFDNKHQVSNIELWFKKIWKELTGEEIDE